MKINYEQLEELVKKKTTTTTQIRNIHSMIINTSTKEANIEDYEYLKIKIMYQIGRNKTNEPNEIMQCYLSEVKKCIEYFNNEKQKGDQEIRIVKKNIAKHIARFSETIVALNKYYENSGGIRNVENNRKN